LRIYYKTINGKIETEDLFESMQNMDKSTCKTETVKLFDECSTLKDYELIEQTRIYLELKERQASKKLIFIVEYIGPLIIFFYLAYKFGFTKLNLFQFVALVLSSLHYSKRIYESLFVHILSEYMPLINIVINSIYYSLLYGYMVGYNIFHQDYENRHPYYLIGIPFFVFFEIWNYACHSTLREMKLKNEGKKLVPNEHLFYYVTAANYTTEILSWISFSVIIGNITCIIFTSFGSIIMIFWARGKHRSYVKRFPQECKNKKIIIPFIY
jgi:very-long-chain enoyl-CoA reductase